MRVGTVDRIEASVQAGAAAAFAAATGFAASSGVMPVAHGVNLWLTAAAATAIAYWLCNRVLALAGVAKPSFPMPPIVDLRLVTTVSAEPDELLLKDAVRAQPAMPTPGQLRAVIDRHLDGGPSRSPPPDASQDLYAALAELRRDLN